MELILLMAIVACTGSMTPEFTCNQSITLTNDFNLTNGEVYVYDNGEKLIIHRLQWFTRFEGIFKADNALYYERVPLDQIKYGVVR